ncbi:MAG: transglutaminase-like domain-containing protein [Myxococcales bacterium]|nr:transglutaminase-like domain-containing protein [Myxococcales bacterium]
MKTYELGKPPGQAALVDALARVPPRLDLGALAIAQLQDAPLDQKLVLTNLDLWADRVHARADKGRLDALVSVLIEDEGFEGDQLTYHAPENSFLDRVIERRKGLPITLTALFIEVGRRAGLEVQGIGLPGHFIARLDDEYFDPFHEGRRLSLEDCQALVAKTGSTFEHKHLAPVSTKAICWRMLNNLKNGWIQQAEPAQALPVVDLLLTLAPKHPAELRLRAGLLLDLGAFRAALTDLEACLKERPEPPDVQDLRRTVQSLQQRIGRLH